MALTPETGGYTLRNPAAWCHVSTVISVDTERAFLHAGITCRVSSSTREGTFLSRGGALRTLQLRLDISSVFRDKNSGPPLSSPTQTYGLCGTNESVTYDGAGGQAVVMLCLYLELGAHWSLQPIVVCTRSPHYTALDFPIKTCPV